MLSLKSSEVTHQTESKKISTSRMDIFSVPFSSLHHLNYLFTLLFLCWRFSLGAVVVPNFIDPQ